MKGKFSKYENEIINELGVTRKSFELGLKDALIRFGNSEQAYKDYLWRCFNELISFFAKNIHDEELMLQKQREVNMMMWSFINDEGKDPKAIRDNVNKLDLLIIRANSEKSVFLQEVELIATNCCTNCDFLDGKKMSIPEAIEAQILPYPECTRTNGCVCSYGSNAVRDNNGHFVRK